MGLEVRRDVLAVVPARAGSKGVPRKNLLCVAGQPLGVRAVRAGLPVVLSTDDEEIRKAGAAAGAIASFLRPAHLATDTASTVAVLQHAVEWYEGEIGQRVTAVIGLQPTSPLRTAEDVRGALAAFDERPAGCESLISVSQASHLNLGILYWSDGAGRGHQMAAQAGVSRHDERQLMIRNGAVYIAGRELLMAQGRVMCDAPMLYRMPRWRSINIDDHFELYLAQLLAEHPPSGPAAEA